MERYEAKFIGFPPVKTVWVVALAVGLLLTNSIPVKAVVFHYFSSAIESSYNSYTAVREYRQDKDVSGIPSDGCSGPIAGTPVYQTMYFYLNGGGVFELGTGHQCADSYVYWFEGWTNTSGTWSLLDYQPGVTEGVSHYFKVKRTSSVYNYWVDSTVVGPAVGANTGYNLVALLESYAPTGQVTFTMSDLAYQRNEGSWEGWSGQDGKNVDSAYMCGRWLSDTSFKAGEPYGTCS